MNIKQQQGQQQARNNHHQAQDVVKILFVSRHPQILATVVRLINNNPQWEAVGVITDEEAKEHFLHHRVDLVMLGSSITEESENEIRAFFRDKNPDILVIQHYGGGSGLLNSEIQEALNQKKNKA